MPSPRCCSSVVTAPDGGYFNDGDRAAGVFGVLATGFSVLLGFVVFLSFTTYDAARAGAETEATVVAQQVETAQLFSPDVADELSGQLVCYARSVAGVQWDRMTAGTLGDDLNPWAATLFQTFQTIDPQTPKEQAAYANWLEQRAAREEGRQARIHGAVGVIPAPLWLVIGFISIVIFVFMLFFADSGERAIVQAVLMGSVVVGDPVDARPAAVPQQPVQPRLRRPAAGGDGASTDHHRPGARGVWSGGPSAVRRAGQPGACSAAAPGSTRGQQATRPVDQLFAVLRSARITSSRAAQPGDRTRPS